MTKKASVKISGISQARDSALKFLNETKKDSDFLNIYAKLAVDQIKSKTAGRQEDYKQKEIKNVTVEARKVYADVYNTSPLAKPKVSNLSLTGQLLGAIKYRINQATSEIIIFISDKRTNRIVPDSIIKEKYNQIIDKDNHATNSKRRDPNSKDKITALFLLKHQKPKTNNEIKDELEDKGRRFFFISDKLKAQLEAKITQQLRRKLDLYNKIRIQK